MTIYTVRDIANVIAGISRLYQSFESKTSVDGNASSTAGKMMLKKTNPESLPHRLKAVGSNFVVITIKIEGFPTQLAGD